MSTQDTAQEPKRQFDIELRGGDYWYVVRLPDRSATGPCYSYNEEHKARAYANMLNRANGYATVN
jgi:hypothetical protein